MKRAPSQEQAPKRDPSRSASSKRDATRDLPRWIFVALAFGVPLGSVAWHAELGHRGDVAFFDEWCAALREGPSFYRDGPGVNYPIVGVGLVCLPEALGDLPFATYRTVLKLSLALAEALTILMLAALAFRIGAPRPRLLASIAYPLAIAPGGAFFVQIDVWGTLWMTIALFALVRSTERPRANAPPRRFAAFVVLAFVATALALLTKQLALFTLPTFAVAVATLLRRDVRALGPVLVSVVLGAGLLVLPDLFLVLPSGWRSHLAFVLFGGGSDHGAILGHHGASVWALFSPDPGAPASTLTLGSLDAQALGWIAFALAQLVLLYRVSRAGFRARALVLHAGATHLAMAVLLTGVHERYLAHGGAWLLVALAGAHRFALAVGALAATGLYVVASVAWESFPPWLREAELAGTLQLWLLIALLVLPFPTRDRDTSDRDTSDGDTSDRDTIDRDTIDRDTIAARA